MMTMFTIDWQGPLTRCWCGLREPKRFPVAHEMIHMGLRRVRRETGVWPAIRMTPVGFVHTIDDSHWRDRYIDAVRASINVR